MGAIWTAISSCSTGFLALPDVPERVAELVAVERVHRVELRGLAVFLDCREPLAVAAVDLGEAVVRFGPARADLQRLSILGHGLYRHLGIGVGVAEAGVIAGVVALHLDGFAVVRDGLAHPPLGAEHIAELLLVVGSQLRGRLGRRLDLIRSSNCSSSASTGTILPSISLSARIKNQGDGAVVGDLEKHLRLELAGPHRRPARFEHFHKLIIQRFPPDQEGLLYRNRACGPLNSRPAA